MNMYSPDRTPTRAGDHASSAVRRERSVPESVGAFGSTSSDSELLFLEGHLPTDPGEPLEGASIEDQVRRCLERMDATLSTCGRSLADVRKLTVYLADLEDYETVNEVLAETFPERPPATSVVGGVELLEGADVQLDAIATRS